MDLSRCIYRRGVEEAASSFIIRSAETGSRTIVNYNGLEEMSVGEFEAVVRGVGSEGERSWWHFEVSPPSPISNLIPFYSAEPTESALTVATRSKG